ncbi:hypothetical protein BJV82DRAFT_710761 [Fennellomyces sp. T-0311]|nr:hypothetical protein BJV82DRAFT_710761 [Fennellomyces sp. T-0311]
MLLDGKMVSYRKCGVTLPSTACQFAAATYTLLTIILVQCCVTETFMKLTAMMVAIHQYPISSLTIPSDEQAFRYDSSNSTSQKDLSDNSDVPANLVLAIKDIKQDFMGNIDTLIHCYDMDIFDTAKDKCYELAKKSNNEKRIISHLNYMLEEKRVSAWGGPWCSKLPHFGNRSTQRVEGAHWAIKLRLNKPGIFLRLYETIDVYLSTIYQGLMADADREVLGTPMYISGNSSLFVDIKGRVSTRTKIVIVQHGVHTSFLAGIPYRHLEL